jgi:hypothetical protein
MRAGRSDQSYLESGTNVQFVMVARKNDFDAQDRREQCTGRSQDGVLYWVTRIASMQVGTQMQAPKSKFVMIGRKVSVPKPTKKVTCVEQLAQSCKTGERRFPASGPRPRVVVVETSTY